MEKRSSLQNSVPYEEELDYLSEIVYKRWAELDAGTLDYDSYINEVIDQGSGTFEGLHPPVCKRMATLHYFTSGYHYIYP